MKKLIILMAVVMSAMLLRSVEVHALTTDKLIVHYYRFDGGYVEGVPLDKLFLRPLRWEPQAKQKE